MNRLRLNVLGAPEIRLDDELLVLNERKVLALLIYLAVTGRPHGRDTLATLFWPEHSQKRAGANLRTTLWSLRKIIGDRWLTIVGDTIQLTADADFEMDLTTFCKLTGRDPAQPPPTSASLGELEDAVALYRGDFLAGFTLDDSPSFDDWQFFEADSAHQTLVMALDTLVEQYSAMPAPEQAIRHARRRLSLDPLHESAHRSLMHLYALSGRQAAALRQAEECQRLLADELGVDPDDETLALALAIRTRAIGPNVSEPPEESFIPSLTTEWISSTIQPDEVNLSRQMERPLFVGREPQLAQLAHALGQARAGTGQLRLITGEAGAGKSALITEFIHRATASERHTLIALGGCDALGVAGEPYRPFREMLGLLTGSRSNLSSVQASLPQAADQTDASWGLACRALLEHGPNLLRNFLPASMLDHIYYWASAAGWSGTFTPSAATTPSPPQMEQSRIFEEYVAVLKAIAAQRSLVLVLEDLHWADATSLALLLRLVRHLDQSNLLILGTYRTEEMSLGPQQGNRSLEQMVLEVQRNLGAVTIDLESDRLAEGRAWVDRLLDASPNRLTTSFRQALYDQTQGHPLFAVELLADMRESGALVQDTGGFWILSAGVNWQALPARVEGAIAGRMARLTDEQRWWLTIAAVVGEHFLVEVVAQVAGVDPRELAQGLSQVLQTQHRLVEAEGVERLGEGRLTRFRFRHNLMQTYLYAQLDEVQCVYLHEDVARVLERLYAEEAKTIPLVLARHYQAAGLATKAIDYLTLAGEQAVRLAANGEAAQHFTQALALLFTLPESGLRHRQELALQLRLGQALMVSQGFGAAAVGTAYTRALALARQLGENGQIVQALLGLSQYALFRSELAVAQAYGEECLHLTAENPNPEHRMVVNRILSRITSQLGQHKEAVTHYEEIIAFYRARQPDLGFADTYSLAFTLAVMGLPLTPLGYPDRALRQAQEGLALMRQLEHHFGVVHCLCIVGYIHLLRGEWQEALSCAREAVVGSNIHNLVQMRLIAQMHEGVVLTRLGQAEEGIALVERTIAEREAMGITFGHRTTTLARLAEACGEANRVDRGLVLIEQALDALEVTNERQYEPKLYQIKGDLLLRHELSPEERTIAGQEAEICLRRAVATAQNQEARLWEARALASLCRLLHSQGRDEGCRQQLVGLYAWFTEGFETEDLRVVRAVLQATM